MTVDAYHGDPRHMQLLGILQQAPRALELLKTASFSEGAVDALPDSAFAWEDARRYPVHTREDALASLLYRSKEASAVPRDVDEKLAAAAQAWDLVEVLREIGDAEKTAAAVPEFTEFALPEMRRLPIESPEQVKVATEVLERDHRKLAFDTALEGFVRLAAAAQKHGVPLTPKVASHAGLCGCDTAMLGNEVGERAALTKVAAVKQAYDTLETLVFQLPPRLYDRSVLVKIAANLHELDLLGGVAKHYGQRLRNPLEAVFNSMDTKVASQGELCDVGGMQAPLQTLMALPPQVWEQLDVPELGQIAQTGDAAQFKQVFDTLPRDLKLILAKQL